MEICLYDKIKMLNLSLAESLSLLLRFCYGSKLSHALYDNFNLPIYYNINIPNLQ